MALDVREGDELTLDGKDYPILRCAHWDSDVMNSAGFRRMAKKTVQVMRIIKGVKTTLPSSHKATPFDSVDAETRKRLALESPHDLLQTFIADGSEFVHVVIENLKR